MQQLIDTLAAQGFSEHRQSQYRAFLEQLQSFSDAETTACLNQLLTNATLSPNFLRATANSEFVQQQLSRMPELLRNCTRENFSEAQRADFYQGLCAELTGECVELQDVNRALRHYRNRAMVGIIWRDFNRLVETEQSTQELTWLAETCVQRALDFHYRVLAEKYGKPRNKKGVEQAMLIIGMGKLGAAELNLSSDIDLIFCFPDKGETDGKRKSLSNQEFFIHLGKAVIQSLDTLTADGFVFRVDMRLRPFGQSGPLVCNFSALEDYYQTQGREWERYAMIKARVIASSLPEQPETRQSIERLNALITQFTYRKYVDFSAIQAMRDLKKKINQEVARRNLEHDVKLGAGGIREIEFIAQVFQVIRGGKDTQLQDNRLLQVLPLLEELHCLPEGTASKLRDAYCFLRNTEHAIQGLQDRQTQKLPVDDDQRLSVARVQDFATWDDFLAQLQAHQRLVQAQFAAVIAEPESAQHRTPEAIEHWTALWQDTQDTDDYLAMLSQAGHEAPVKCLEYLEDLRLNGNVRLMHPSGQQRLDAFIPRLLEALAGQAQPTETLRRVLLLVKSVVRRSAYLLLLIENPDALQRLVQLAGASPWIAEELAAHPALLDELIDSRTLYHAPDKAELADELRRATLRIPEDDLEAQMFALRYFRSAHALRVAACEITGILPLMKVSDYLTWLAEALLEGILQLSWEQMVARYGYPDGEERDTPRFIIVGYGKLGGIELNHGSDLDLVFIHNAAPMGMSDGDQRGAKSIDNQTFYQRLGQKIIHMLDTRMASGQLYEVDMRLRPSGNSGMLVATLAAFERYQQTDAWTWEHQALVRARALAGDSQLQQQFADLRKAILCQERDADQLREDVVAMRNKMLANLGSQQPAENFHLKQDRGGIVDIEFMVQYAVLAWAHGVPALTEFTDNIRILECLAHSELLSAQEVDKLTSAYKALRSTGHKLTLQQQSNLIPHDAMDDEVRAAQKLVAQLWRKLFETA